MEIYFTRTLLFQINGPTAEVNNPFYKNRDNCGKLGWNPSAKKS